MRGSPYLVEDFLLPALNSGSYGKYLEWVDPVKRTFRVLYQHKNGKNWSEDSANVYMAWSLLKGHRSMSDGYSTTSRHRFKIALKSSTKLATLAGTDKAVGFFRILEPWEVKKKKSWKVLGRCQGHREQDPGHDKLSPVVPGVKVESESEHVPENVDSPWDSHSQDNCNSSDEFIIPDIISPSATPSTKTSVLKTSSSFITKEIMTSDGYLPVIHVSPTVTINVVKT